MPDAITNEWIELVAVWNTDGPAAHVEALRQRVEAERRRMIVGVAVEIAVTVLFAGAATYATLRFPGNWSRLVAIDIAAITIGVWTFVLWNRRGIWRPLGESTEAFLRLARLRCLRKLQAIRFSVALIVAQLLAVAVWVWWGPQQSPLAPSLSVRAIPAIVVVLFVVALTWSRRRVRQELTELDQWHAQLTAQS